MLQILTNRQVSFMVHTSDFNTPIIDKYNLFYRSHILVSFIYRGSLENYQES